MKCLRKLSLISLLVPLSLQAVQIDVSIKDKEKQKKIVYTGLFALTTAATALNLALLIRKIRQGLLGRVAFAALQSPKKSAVRAVFTPQTICMSVVEIALLASLIYFSTKMYKHYAPTTKQKLKNRVKHEVNNIIS